MAVFFENQVQFREWLSENHHKATELNVGYYKVKSAKPSMTWSESVDQALCFGWIDGVRKSIDADSYCIRFTPRKKDSIWSSINIAKVEKLNTEGLMTPAGLKAYSYRKEHKSSIYSHEKERASLDVHLQSQFNNEAESLAYFQSQAPSYQKVILHWIMSAKQEKTRQSRFDKLLDACKQKKRLN